ncbi:hypothetical protein LBMAG42_54810 [Deltaproteobacteria bacterium]|nr:hypothetical protein LBMAG42_54810 [Deltaproteobacteria bacterium]
MRSDQWSASIPAPPSIAEQRAATQAAGPPTLLPPYAYDPNRGGIAPDPNASPLAAAFLNVICITGAGQLYNGQVAKGILLFIASLFLVGASSGACALLTWPLAIVDAWLIASKRRNGQHVGTWECF